MIVCKADIYISRFRWECAKEQCRPKWYEPGNDFVRSFDKRAWEDAFEIQYEGPPGEEFEEAVRKHVVRGLYEELFRLRLDNR